MMTPLTLLLAVLVAVTSCVWVCILTQPGNLFAWVPGVYYRYVGTDKEWLEKILFGCTACNAGQLALWSYPFASSTYSISGHFVTVILSIFFAKIMGKWL